MTARAAMLVLIIAFATNTFAAPPANDAPPSIAVLDFVNRTPAEDIGWLGKSLADMVITDLATSKRLLVIDRERTQEIGRELELQNSALADERTASRVGRVAKVQWVLFGSFAREGKRISIEAMIIDLRTQQVRRVDRVEGEFAALFDLERQLLQRVLSQIDQPMSEKELESVSLMQTRSLPAAEHYGRALLAFDEGELFEAIAQSRLAAASDAAFGKAKARLAQLYYQAGELKHAVIEYQRLFASDAQRELPDSVYFEMGGVFEEARRDDEALKAYQRIVTRRQALLRPEAPPPTYEKPPPNTPRPPAWRAYQNTLQDRLTFAIRALDRSAAAHDRLGQRDEALKCFSRIAYAFHYYRGLIPGTSERLRKIYEPRYWRAVQENRDGGLTPLQALGRINPEEHPDADKFVGTRNQNIEADDAWIRRANYYMAWLAPPGKEIARITYNYDTDLWKTSATNTGMYTAWQEPPPGTRGDSKMFMVKSGVKPVEWNMPPGVRGIRFTGNDEGPMNDLKFELRPWSGRPAAPATGRVSIDVLPSPARAFIDAQPTLDGRLTGFFGFEDSGSEEHTVEARWLNGRRITQKARATPGQVTNLTMNLLMVEPKFATLSSGDCRHIHAMKDRAGRCWVVWDESPESGRESDATSDLYASTSLDGVTWSPKRRLPVSSLALDAAPVLQQDRRGTFWLAWLSDRDPDDPLAYWIASSPDGVQWSFPRKIKPDTPASKDEERRWRYANYRKQSAFAIDREDVFWIYWRQRLYSSADARVWKRGDALRVTVLPNENRDSSDLEVQLQADSRNRLVAVVNGFDRSDRKNTQRVETVWRREARGEWSRLGRQVVGPQACGALALGPDGTMYWVLQGLHQVELYVGDGEASWSAATPLNRRSKDPAVLPLDNGRVLFAYGNKDWAWTSLAGLEVVSFGLHKKPPIDLAQNTKAGEIDHESRMGWGIGFDVAPIIANDANFEAGETIITVQNPAGIEMEAEGVFTPTSTLAAESGKVSVRVPPYDSAKVPVKIRATGKTPVEHLGSIRADWKITYKLPGLEPLTYQRNHQIGVEAARNISRRTTPVTVDGKLDDWKQLPFVVDKPGQIRLDPASHTGPDDLTFRFGLEYDDEFLYIAIQADDDRRVLDARKEVWEQDGVEVRLDARPQNQWGRGMEFDDYLCILLSPPAEPGAAMLVYRPTIIAPGVKYICVNTDRGHATEIAIPLAYLNEKQGKPWQNLRFNIAVDDYDPGDKGAQAWWKPDWRFDKNVAGTGTLRRQ